MPSDPTDVACDQVVRENVRRLRNERGLSQHDLAVAADITRAYLGRIEARGQNLTLSTLSAIAAALDVEPWQLLHPTGGDQHDV